METRVITIIGLGRTGASVGLALQKSQLDVTIVGHDSDPDAMTQAKEMGAVDETQRRLVPAAATGDIIIIAMPAPEVEDVLRAIGADVQEHALVLDLSNLKAPGQSWAERYLERGHFVGASPVLAADALDGVVRGLDGARADLFQDSIWCLMPSSSADPKAVETAVNLGRLLGAKPFFLDAAEFDSLVQGVETAPGLMAAAMFRAVTNAAGWRDMLRFAGAPFARSTEVLREGEEIAHLALHDQAATLRWLDALLEELETVRSWVAEGDRDRLVALLTELNDQRERWLHERAENDWEEVPQQDTGPPGLVQRFLGSRGTETL
ncbi:MAG: prephenate dehydrogenase/arogenate dehydrogenase family protein [Candidatus Promineifilaceae bacterium]|nr:prephenate dehydrogenase/arogenate dehydrogenase family protein [Candidatus Promineifilaceae bacterium]